MNPEHHQYISDSHRKILEPQYKIQGGYFFESLLTGKFLQRSHWIPVNYDTFNTKGCPHELIFFNFRYQPILPNYCDFLNDDGDDDNNIHVTPVYDVLMYN